MVKMDFYYATAILPAIGAFAQIHHQKDLF